PRLAPMLVRPEEGLRLLHVLGALVALRGDVGAVPLDAGEQLGRVDPFADASAPRLLGGRAAVAAGSARVGRPRIGRAHARSGRRVSASLFPAPCSISLLPAPCSLLLTRAE